MSINDGRHEPRNAPSRGGLQVIRELVAEREQSLRYLFVLVFVPVFVPSLVLFLLGQFAHISLEPLKVSSSSPWWTVFTYIFVHDNFDNFSENFGHFLANIIL